MSKSEDHHHKKEINNQEFSCPMHPEVRQSQEGICPLCGMKLVPIKKKTEIEEKESSDKHAGHALRSFARKFWLSLILTIPVIFFSEIAYKLFGLPISISPGSPYLRFIFGSIIFFYGGWVFIRGAKRELQAKLPGMMTLIALAISVAYSYSVIVTFIISGEDLFWELTTLITIMLLGHWLEMRAVQGAQRALQELSKLLPETAEIIEGTETKIISLKELKIGDLVLVRPGAKIPADGQVREGESEVNEAVITGESKPVRKLSGSEVIAGSINGDGGLKVEITKIGENTFLAGVMRLVAEAQASKSRLQTLSDKAAFYLTIIAVLSGALTFLIWLLASAGFNFALERLVAVLVIACPHALGLAIPLVASISTALAARSGFLVRDRLSLEAARNVNIVLFDKTGTLTKGEFGVQEIIINKEAKLPRENFEINENTILQWAASADNQAEHFLAQAIVKEAQKRNLELWPAQNFQALKGRGVIANVQAQEVLVGGDILFREKNLIFSGQFKETAESLAQQGKTIIYLIVNNEILGAIALVDLIRDESREAIKELKEMEVKVAMITGDSEEVAEWVAKELEIDEYFARVLPQEKAEKVKLLQGNGYRVAMVGDGINDAPALVGADVGIAIGAGTNVAIESAGIVLVRNDPRDIAKIIKLSRRTYRKMIQNLFWATGYNIVALPLAAGVLASHGILLQPALAAVFMSLSTVIVAINAMALRRVQL
ncbi:MAG: heavy metal translocating P-type ATPase [bacterium]